MSDRQEQIYQTDADRYQALISREDRAGSIPRAIDDILDVDSLAALDLGAGTGRLSLMLAPRLGSIGALDVSAEMLRVCRQGLVTAGHSHAWVARADHRRVPVSSHSVDLVVSGWSVSYLAVWNPTSGVEELDAWLAEMRRVLKQDGTIILFESLGTGNESPIRLPHMEPTYDWLDAHGFQKRTIRTDYRFDSVEEAVELSRFFFGDHLAERVEQKGSRDLPECTGVWWRQI